ncbi:MAG: hypothetical protein CYPHOPRED_003579 [Cyphobasidiales sp. Tagirdzhanova-0007]|nr:MAG: hypothetical protein CYPHOPRED_003579 [Cyphobasidiales sp. Tagirdzhanova-0007]
MWHSLHAAVLSSDPGRPIFNAFSAEGVEKKAPAGRLLLYYLDSRQVTPVVINGWPEGRPFHPLGIGLLESSSPSSFATAILAVANYQQHSASVEMFRLTAKPADLPSTSPPSSISAVHLRTFEHPSITSPNAVVPLSESHVIFTNSYRISPRRTPLLAKLELMFAYPGGRVIALFGDANGQVASTTLASGIAIANGLALNADRSILAVAGSMSHSIHVYDVRNGNERITDSTQLRLRKTVPVGFSTDNLQFVHQHGKKDEELLLAAGHPDALAYLRTAKTGGGTLAPSRIAKIRIAKAVPAAGTPPSLLQRVYSLFEVKDGDAVIIFESLGSFYGTSSTAAPFRDPEHGGKQEMLVTSLWEHGMMRCKDVDLS